MRVRGVCLDVPVGECLSWYVGCLGFVGAGVCMCWCVCQCVCGRGCRCVCVCAGVRVQRVCGDVSRVLRVQVCGFCCGCAGVIADVCVHSMGRNVGGRVGCAGL